MEYSSEALPPLSFAAINPFTGKPSTTVLMRRERAGVLVSGRPNREMELIHLVPLCLKQPSAIFQGLRWDNDEPGGRHSVCGRFCFVLKPRFAFRADGGDAAPRPGRVFMVFVDQEWYIYRFWWDEADPANDTLPSGHRERFKERLI